MVALRNRGYNPDDGRGAVYRHFADDGTLLYVGYSANPYRRTEQHSQEAFWFGKITRIEIDWHPTKELALAAEREAIYRETPLCNWQNLEDYRGWLGLKADYSFLWLPDTAEHAFLPI